MLRSKNIDRICCVVLACTMLLTGLFACAASAGVFESREPVTYADRLFDQSVVHTIDIVIDDWDAFLATCTAEEYSVCSLVIDGEKYTSVGIRGKGNTSLSQVAQYGNNRYSFKIEFDHYQKGKSYHGLDKLCLNNIIQDATYMKDYLSYTLMNRLGVNAPLCSFVQINVNGEYWGLYLAVEAVEDGFLTRNFNSEDGDLYKPDSTQMGGGKGNGRDFDMDDFREKFEQRLQEAMENGEDIEEALATMMPDFGGEGFPTPPDFDGESEFPGAPEDMNGEFPGAPDSADGEFPTPPDGEEVAPQDANEDADAADDSEATERRGRRGGFGGGNGGGMGMSSDDVLLKYIDDDPDSYANIFENAKTDVTEADEARLIAALKALNEGEDIASCVNVDEVIRYFIVHGFVVNGDSYTGSMIHNYYLYEQDGLLSMIPWDYNLAFGTFSMGGGSSDGATSAVNNPIDTPVTSGSVEDRPMLAWIFESEEYTELYHQIYAEFMADIYESGWLMEEIDRVAAMIDEYVKDDPTAFFTYDEFLTGVEALKTFCEKRCESVVGQLNGEIPSTQEGQNADGTALIDASDLSLSDMGGFGGGNGGGDMRGGFDRTREGGFDRRSFGNAESGEVSTNEASTEGGAATPPDAPHDNTEDAGSEDAGAPMTEDGNADAPSMPEDFAGAPEQGGGFPSGDFGGMESGSNAGEQWIWFGASIALLIAGLAFAMLARKCR